MAAVDISQGCELNELQRHDFSAVDSPPRHGSYTVDSTRQREPCTVVPTHSDPLVFPTTMTTPMTVPPASYSPVGPEIYPNMSLPSVRHSYSPRQYGATVPDKYDMTGQIAPPGLKPRVTATLWEDEGSLCFQVEARGVCVARREDNHFINGTKLLNVAGMTRGRRDGILKSERTRHLVKVGPMHLKGVWIPFDRALDFANKEQITHLLYPLFVHNIGGLLYNPENASRTKAVVQARDSGSLGTTSSSRAPQSAQSAVDLPRRPGIDWNHTFPTQPTSGSSLMGMSNDVPSNYEWDGENIFVAEPLLVDTGIKARSDNKGSRGDSLPCTPSITPTSSPQPYVEFEHDQERSQQSILDIEPATTSGLEQQYDASAQVDPDEDARSATLSPSKAASPDHITNSPVHHVSFTNQKSTDVVHKSSIAILDRSPGGGNLTFPTLSLPQRARGFTLARQRKGRFDYRQCRLKCDEGSLNYEDHMNSSRRRRGETVHQDDSRTTTYDQEGGLVETLTFHEAGLDIEKASPTTSITSTEDGIVSRSAVDDRIITVCSRVLLSAYAHRRGTNYPPPTETCGVDDPKTVSKTGDRKQPQGSGSSQQLQKRRRAEDGDSGDEGKDRRKKSQRTVIEPPKGFERPLACPFNKFDNRLFGPDSPNETYHPCATCNFVNIAHLKQHLRRNHYLPKHYCYRCCRQDFASDSMVAAHLREEPICVKVEPPRYLERIGPDLIEELSIERKNTPGTAREEYWHRVYNTFFPGAADLRPVTAYYEGPVAEHLEQFLRFSYSVVGDLYEAVQRRADAPAVADHSDMISVHHDILQQAGQQYLEQMMSSTLPVLGHPLKGAEGINRVAIPLVQQSHAEGEDAQRLTCHSRAGGPRSITSIDQDTGASLTTASDVSSPLFPRTPSRIGDTENHGVQSAAIVSQTYPLPSQNPETGRGNCKSPAEEGIFNQDYENASLHHLTSDGFGSPLHFNRDLNFDWNTEIDQMMKSNTGEWDLFTTI